MWQVPYSYGSQSLGAGFTAAPQRVVVRFSVLHFNKAIKWTASPLLVCGLTLRNHKPINSKAAIYGGVSCTRKFYEKF